MTDTNTIRHVALIMDGNGRWAKERGHPRYWGHKYGADRFREILLGAPELGLDCISFYAFSKENWTRPQKEVDIIMSLWREYVTTIVDDLVSRNIRLKMIGDLSDLSDEMQHEVRRVERDTEHCTGMLGQVMVSYGSRWEILQAVQSLASQIASGQLAADELDEAHFDAALLTAGAPDPDLLIRTSGEQRISNYMLWQLSYSEMMFVPELWPDFTLEHLRKCIDSFGERERRFGGVG